MASVPIKSTAIKLLPALVFAILPPALSPLFLGPEDTVSFLAWATCFTFFAVLASPLASRLFPESEDGGWLYAHLLGLLIPAFLVWTLAHMSLALFTRTGVLVVSVILAITLPVLLSLSGWQRKRLDWNHGVRRLSIRIAESGLFLAALLFWTYIRSHKPELYGLEKFMDYGFMMSMWRGDTLPAQDMWLAGHSINYYYFGQYLFTFVSKLSGVRPAVSYNLSIAASFALTFTLSFALLRDLLQLRLKEVVPGLDLSARIAADAQTSETIQVSSTSSARRPGQNLRFLRSRLVPAFGGLAGATLLTLGGNSHAFFYGTHQPGNALVRFLELSDVQVGKLGNFFFSDSTRFIGYNPETADKTIHEFPYYSYLVADLHAHMINLSIVVLLLAVLFALVLRLRSSHYHTETPAPGFAPRQGSLNLGANQPILQTGAYPASKRERSLELGANQPILQTDAYPSPKRKTRTLREWIPTELVSPHFLLLGILLGIAAMANYWDFVIYFVVSIVSLLAAYTSERKQLGSLKSFGLMLLQFVAVFVPYLLVPSPLPQLLLFVLAAVASVVLYHLSPTAWTRTGQAGTLLFLLAHLAALPFNLGFDPMAKTFVLSQAHSGLYRLFILWFAHVALALLFAICFFYYKAKDGLLHKSARSSVLARIFGQNAADVFILLLILCALGLIIAPEILYVKDIYEGSFARANTMFKFTYQSFALLSLAAVYTLGALFQRLIPVYAKPRLPAAPGPSETLTGDSLRLPKRFRGARAIGRDNDWRLSTLIPLLPAILLFTIPFYYTREIKSWYGTLAIADRLGLDGTGYYGTLLVADDTGTHYELKNRLALIDYLNAEVEEQPVILEAFGDSYSDYSAVSAYTGLPTVLGWQTHEWLWRTSVSQPNAYTDLVAPLQDEIRAFYEAHNPVSMPTFVQERNIRYIVVGELERIQFAGIAEETLKSLGEVVFSSGGDYLIKVRYTD